MGGHQEKACINCKHFPSEDSIPCILCVGYDNWQSKRGRPKGSKPKPGHNKLGPKFKPPGEKMCHPILSIKEKDLEAYGGLETLKADVKKMVNDKITK